MNKDAWNPHQYQKFQSERAQPFFDLLAMLDVSSKAGTVVDLGCGTGELTKILHEKTQTERTIGIDQSPKMLEEAASYASENLNFVPLKIEEFREPTQYDIIFSNAALQWCDHHPKLFASIRASLKPGGQLAVQMPMNHHYPTHTVAGELANEEPFRSALANQGGPRQFPLLSIEAYAQLLFHLGFSRQNVCLKVYGHILENREQTIEWVKGTLLTYYQSRLSHEQYIYFMDEYRQRLFAKIPDEKPFFFPFQRILLWAQID